MRIKQGMYVIKQETILDYDQLVKHLKTHGYYLVIGTDEIFAHKIRKTKFCLCVDDFGIKYHSTDDADHIIYSIKNICYCQLLGRELFLCFNLLLELRDRVY